MEIAKTFDIRDRVKVSSNGGWANDPTGVVVGGPDPITTMQGRDFFYWVEFDTPQQDLDGDGPYKKAQILSRYLEALAP